MTPAIWSDTLPATAAEPALTVELVPSEHQGATIVRTVGALGLQGPSYHRETQESGLAKAQAVFDALLIKRRIHAE